MKLHKTLFCALLISLAITVSCTSPRTNLYAAESKKEIDHPNGLNLKIAESLRPIQTENGFSINPQEKLSLRNAINFSVSVHKDENAPPENSDIKRRAIGNRVIMFRQSEAEAGGSSGDEIIRALTAWETIPNGFVLYEQETPETHFAENIFDLLWYVAEGADFEAKK